MCCCPGCSSSITHGSRQQFQNGCSCVSACLSSRGKRKREEACAAADAYRLGLVWAAALGPLSLTGWFNQGLSQGSAACPMSPADLDAELEGRREVCEGRYWEKRSKKKKKKTTYYGWDGVGEVLDFLLSASCRRQDGWKMRIAPRRTFSRCYWFCLGLACGWVYYLNVEVCAPVIVGSIKKVDESSSCRPGE